MTRIPFHYDLALGPATVAGPYPVFDPGAGAVEIRHIRVSTRAAMRVIVGTADADGSRMLDVYLPAGGAGALSDCDIPTIGTGMLGQPVLVITDAAGAVSVGIDGCYVTP